MNHENITLHRHDSREQILTAFFKDAFDGEPVDLSQMGVETTDGESVGAGEMLNEMDCWAFADTGKGEIHWWAEAGADRATVAHALGHEIGHLLDPHEDIEADEANAERYGRAFEAAFKVLT